MYNKEEEMDGYAELLALTQTQITSHRYVHMIDSSHKQHLKLHDHHEHLQQSDMSNPFIAS
jgi:hypothetical protein